ncbi:FxDxF family PEP-CTERM protein [Acinetobacter baumannii]
MIESTALVSGALSVTPVPEPETYALLLAGLGLIGAAARRRRG